MIVGSRFASLTSCWLALVATGWLADPASAAAPGAEGTGSDEAAVLEIGTPVARDLAPGETHRYRFTIEGRQRFHCAVEQQGIDVEIEVVDGAGSGFVVDSPFDRFGTETFLVSGSGAVALTIRGRETGAPRGRYVLRLAALEAAVTDPRRLDALRARTAAARNYPRGTADAWRQAAIHFARADAQWTAVGESRAAAFARYGHAVLERLTDEPRVALDSALDARDRFSALGESRFEAYAWNEIGLDQWNLEHHDAARDAFGRSRDLGSRIGDDFVVAAAASNLCLLDLAESAIPRARRCYEAALPVIERARAPQSESAALTNLGRIAEHLGEPADARRAYTRAIDVLRRAGDRRSEARTRNNLGVLERGLGNFEAAMAHYIAASALFETLQDRRWQARTRNNIGYVHLGLEQPRRAEASFARALAIFRDIEDARGEAASLDNLGLVDQLLGHWDAAVDRHEAALVLRRRLGHRRAEAVTLRRLAEAKLSRDIATRSRDSGPIDPGTVELLKRAVAIAEEAGDRPSESAARRRLGEALLAGNDLENAEFHLTRALALARTAGQRVGEAQILGALARAARIAGDGVKARRLSAKAIGRLEDLRTGLENQDFRTSFSGILRDAYALGIALTMEAHGIEPGAGHARRGLALAERARMRALLDAIRDAEVDLDASLGSARIRARRDLIDQLRAKSARLTDAELDADSRRALDADRQTAIERLDALDAEIRRHHPAYAEIVRPRPLDADRIQDLVDAETVLAVFFLGEENSYLWRITDRAIDAFTLAGRDRIEAAADTLHRRLRELDVAGRAEDHEAARRLAALLRLDVLVDDESKARLAIVGDGALDRVPFAALPLPGRASKGRVTNGPVISRFEVVSLPSASVLGLDRRLRRRPPRRPSIAVVANPAFGPDFAHLPSSHLEAEAIARATRPDQYTALIGPDARVSAVTGSALRPFSILHFATHGEVDLEHPGRSGLVLAADVLAAETGASAARSGFLSLPEIYRLDLDADLVVLSGCQTALGPEVRGEGPIGLARGFQFAGARRVVASLWRVDDRATAALMTRFYQALASEGTSAAQALAWAQATLATSRRFRDPFYWAGFVHIGEWRWDTHRGAIEARAIPRTR